MIHAPDQFYGQCRPTNYQYTKLVKEVSSYTVRRSRVERAGEGPEPWLGKPSLRHITLQVTLMREDAGASARFEDNLGTPSNQPAEGLPLWARLENTRTLPRFTLRFSSSGGVSSVRSN